MILFTLFALFFAVFLLWRRARLVVAIAGIGTFWLLATGWLAAPLLDWAQPDVPRERQAIFAPRTALIVLGDGTEHDDNGSLVPKRDAMIRIAKAAELYAECKRREAVCTVILSGGNPQRHETSEADNYAPYLLRLHVAKTDVLLENTSLNTYQNARNVARILRGERYDSLMLVTSAYQMPRALLDFARFGLSPHPIVSNARHIRRGVLPRYTNLVNTEVALHELIGIAQFHVYCAIGWF
ncbi:YdcF family protein [Trinickia violacea]|uniref:YdcF family protein n=1 Tax=Trinickia violacea TaxID=2571746 RepID=A0A4P8IPF3_9BURK|nr:YdcF family protein [Trinickia violacea]QCP49981.1 YdcF family protein [Trinickia violacea]